MIAAQGVSLQYGGRVLFNDVNINFTKGNCYGLIGANGAGKSTFLKILAGELEPNKGSVFITPGERMAVLKQDHFLFDDFEVVECVLYGHKRLYDIRKEKDALYMKEDFTDEDGIKAAELEGEFAEQELYKQLLQHLKDHNYAKESTKELEFKALQLHASRIFDNEAWVDSLA